MFVTFVCMRLFLNEQQYIDTRQGIDVSIPLTNAPDSVRAWYCEPVKIEPVKTEHFIGDVLLGGSVNFRNIFLNPHGNGTHTECVGHISRENYTINQCLKEFHFKALLVSVEPELMVNGEAKDQVVTGSVLKQATAALNKNFQDCKAILIRTRPNAAEKVTHNYSNTNPAYLSVDAIDWILDNGFDHLVLDLPSVDKEVDGGILAGHHRFWEYPENTRLYRTITELAYFPDDLTDGVYLLNIHITSLESDASPSKLIVYRILNTEIKGNS